MAFDEISYSKAKNVEKRLDQAIESGQNLDGWIEETSKLGQRIDQNQQQVTSQLAQIGDEVKDRSESNYQIYKSGTAYIRTRKPTFTIQDDDVRTELYTKLYPIAQEYNVPVSAGLISGRMGDNHPNTITMEQFYEMRDSGLVEFCNHTHSHQHLTQMTIEEAEEDIRLCEEWLEKHGCGGVKHLIYPFGDYNADVREVASKYVHSATRSNDHIINPDGGTISTFALNRVVFEAEMELIKQRIDDIAAVNGWLILNTHTAYETFDEDKMREIIEYALSKGVDFSNFSDAYRKFSNIIQIYDGSTLLGTISASGVKRGIFATPEGSSGSGLEYIDSTNVLATDPPSKFQRNVISTTNFTKGRGETNGWGGAGVLFHDNRGSDDYAYQLFHPLNSDSILKRTWSTTLNDWRAWADTSASAKTGSKLFSSIEYTLPAFGRQSVSIPITDLQMGDSMMINPLTGFPTFFMYTIHVVEDGRASLRLFNFSDIERIVPETDWVVRWFKN